MERNEEEAEEESLNTLIMQKLVTLREMLVKLTLLEVLSLEISQIRVIDVLHIMGF